MVGLRQARSSEDEEMLKQILLSVGASSASSGSLPLYIVDARPMINAVAQQAIGRGTERQHNYTNTQVLKIAEISTINF